MAYKIKKGDVVNVKGTDTFARVIGIKKFEMQPNHFKNIYELKSLNEAKWRVDKMPKGKEFTSGREFIQKV